MEVIWFGSEVICTKVKSPWRLTVFWFWDSSSCFAIWVFFVDENLSVKQHVNKSGAMCCCQLWWLRQVYHHVGLEVTTHLSRALVMFRLDYCNSVLASVPKVYSLNTAAYPECHHKTIFNLDRLESDVVPHSAALATSLLQSDVRAFDPGTQCLSRKSSCHLLTSCSLYLREWYILVRVLSLS